MNKLKVISRIASVKLGRTGLLLKKHSPEIMLVVGVVGFGYSIWKMAKAEPKGRKIIEEMKYEMDVITEAKDQDGYTQRDYYEDIGIVGSQSIVQLVKLYGPPIALGTVSVACIFGSHAIMRNRNIALMAAYTVIDEAFKNYRGRVIEDYGEEVDRRFKLGIRQEQIVEEIEDENGKKKKIKKTIDVYSNDHSKYARFYDETCKEWSSIPEYNLNFLKCQQAYANDLLLSRGHVFLNEVYDSLGIERTKAGALVGWVAGNGDSYIDFGVYDGYRKSSRNFVNGHEPVILLDFNVDGVIIDLI